MGGRRRRFYLTMTVVFPLFFMLHWNGMFSQTYYWALEAIDGTRAVGPQAGVAFISALLIFAVIALVFEGLRAWRRPRP
ncbi:MAG: hypothetical protein H0X64_00560 [Gemmatimonadaceae bacterium]|nr:hypothetical protein [Gemmatimonadaceae bacterium]